MGTMTSFDTLNAIAGYVTYGLLALVVVVGSTLLAFSRRSEGKPALPVVDVRPVEVHALLWSFGYFFFLLSTYYMLLPLRDAMGIEGGTRNLPWLFSATFVAVLLTAPLQAALAARLPRRQFVPVIYLFLAANMALFWFLMSSGVAPVIVARVFFVWVTVFSVLTVSLFWSFMADLYSAEQSKRLFGFVAAGGSVGSILGPMLTRQLVEPLGVANLLLVATTLLVLAVACANRLEGAAGRLRNATAGFVAASAGKAAQQSVGGGIFDGFVLLFRSAYLGGIALWVFLLSMLGTFLYFTQAEVVSAASSNTAEATAIFATIAQWVGLLSLAMQLLVSGRILKALGTGPAAALLPLVFVLGFIALALSPVLLVIAAFQALQRAANFGIANLARESLWTVVSREEKFKAKNIIDGSVFRGADMANGWLHSLLASLMSLPALAALSAVIAAGWAALSFGLGKAQERKAREPQG
jgi:AAA family ATP:ADP antiporter